MGSQHGPARVCGSRDASHRIRRRTTGESSVSSARMRQAGLGLAIVLFSAAPARATTCMYGTSYNDPDIHGPCFVDAIAGCPIHLVMPQAPPPVELTPTVLRNGQLVSVSSATMVVGTVAPTITTIDYYSCDCHRTTAAMTFNELALTLTGALAGDVVSVGGREITIKRWVGVLLVLLLAFPLADAAPARGPGKNFWRILVKPGGKWILYLAQKDKLDEELALTINTYDVRKVAGADVARLRGAINTPQPDDFDLQPFSQVAVTAAGIYLLRANMNDAMIAEALKHEPSFPDPPKAAHKTDGVKDEFVELHDNAIVCVGFRGPPHACIDYCSAEMCVSATEGIVRLSGAWAPFDHQFAQKKFWKRPP